jgi:hypothetical protein
MEERILYWLDLESNRLLDTKIVFGNSLDIRPERFCEVATRGGITLFVASLTEYEIRQAGEVKTLQELLLTEETDWSTIGMILNGISVNGRGTAP